MSVPRQVPNGSDWFPIDNRKADWEVPNGVPIASLRRVIPHLTSDVTHEGWELAVVQQETLEFTAFRIARSGSVAISVVVEIIERVFAFGKLLLRPREGHLPRFLRDFVVDVFPANHPLDIRGIF